MQRTITTVTTFRFGKRSEQRLSGLHPDLIKVVRRALQVATRDFTVLEGLRTEARQRQLVADGASQTMNSRHLTGHAVDIAPLDDGEPTWQWQYYFGLASAVQQAAQELDIPIRWGGCWDRRLNGLGDPEAAQVEYIARRRALGKKPFLDGPHFELARTAYP